MFAMELRSNWILFVIQQIKLHVLVSISVLDIVCHPIFFRFIFCNRTLHSMALKHVSLLVASTAVRMHRPLSQLQVLVNVVFVYEKNKRDNTISWMQYAIGMPGNSFV